MLYNVLKEKDFALLFGFMHVVSVLILNTVLNYIELRIFSTKDI